MAQQFVYFTQPSVISQLQTKVGSPFASNVNVASTAVSNLNQYLQSRMTCPVGTGSNQDLNGIAHHGMFCIGGNAFSNEEVFTSTGVINAQGTGWTQNHYVRFASQSKMIGGLVIAKMMEEGYLKPTDYVSQYIPEFTGTAYYCTGGSGSLGVYGQSYGSYTGYFSSFSLNNVTISHLLGFQFGVPSSEFLTGNSVLSWQTNAPADWNLNLCYKTCWDALALGKQLGPAGCFANGNGLRDPSYDNFFKASGFVYGPITDYVLTLCNCLKAGSVVCTFEPGAIAQGFSGLIVPRAQYGTTLTLMSYVCQKALTGSAYSDNLVGYVRDKIFTPIGIDKTLWWGGCETGPDDRFSQTVQISFRKNEVLCSGPYGTGTTALGYSPNSLVWSSQYPTDSYATTTLPGIYTIDPPNFNGGLIGRPSMFCKLLKLIINNGQFTNSEGITTQVVSRPAVNWIFNCFGSTSQLFEARSYFGTGGPSANQKWCLGFMKQDDSLASSTNNENFRNVGVITFPMSPSVAGWGGFFGTSFCIDLVTGYYLMIGYQEQGSGSSVNFNDWQRITVPLMSYLSRLE